MMIEYLVRKVFHEPSLITPGAHASIRQLLQSKIETGEFIREGTDSCGGKVEVPGMVKEGGIAYIPIAGAIGQGMSGFAKGRGAVDVADVSREIEDAMADKDIKSILFEFDSPGGMVSGTPELAGQIRSITKPKYAFTSGMIASAAYWLASACDGIFATESSEIGSIGVYLPFHDLTKAAEMEGVKVDLIKAGTLKGIGYPGTSLMPEQRQHLQERVNDIYQMFTSHVRATRGEHIHENTMQGQTFLAKEALSRGLNRRCSDFKARRCSDDAPQSFQEIVR
jgi:signal peptide peptidase SppA